MTSRIEKIQSDLQEMCDRGLDFLEELGAHTIETGLDPDSLLLSNIELMVQKFRRAMVIEEMKSLGGMELRWRYNGEEMWRKERHIPINIPSDTTWITYVVVHSSSPKEVSAVQGSAILASSDINSKDAWIQAANKWEKKPNIREQFKLIQQNWMQIERLRSYLESKNELGKYGKNGAKAFEELAQEIESGESYISWVEVEDYSYYPRRHVTVVNIEVHCTELGKILYEDRQIFADGTVKQRGFSWVSEKMSPVDHNNPYFTASRALKEELNLPNDGFSFFDDQPIIKETTSDDSSSYPGILSIYELHTIKVDLKAEYFQDEYREVQATKTTVFKWR